MKLLKSKIDSALLKVSIYDLIDFENDYTKFNIFEKKVISKRMPDIVEIKIDTSEVEKIKFFEDQGFRFSEFKIFRILNLHEKSWSYTSKYPYNCIKVNSTEKLNEIIKIANYTQFDDRFSNNIQIPKSISLERNIKFLKKSYLKADESIICITNQNTKEIVCYQSFKRLNKNGILLFLDGTIPKYDYMKETFFFIYQNWFIEQEYFFIKSFSSGENIKDINSSLKVQGYNIDSTYVILEKKYK